MVLLSVGVAHKEMVAMSDSKTDSSIRKRKWPRISVRTLLIAVSVLGVLIGVCVNAERRQRKAVAEIEAMGGKVTLENRFVPTWIANRVSPHYFHTVTEADFNGFHWHREQPDKELDVDRLVGAVGNLSLCRSLTIHLVGLRDDDIRKLRPLADQIERLSLREIRSEDLHGPGLTHLKNWSRLESLHVSFSNFKELDCSELATCPRLEEISLGGGGMSKEHFDQLARCKTLTTISIHGCHFEGEWLKSFRDLSRLKTLSLTNCSPEPFVAMWRVSESGEKTPVSEPTYHFRGGDPQFVVPKLFEPGFPNKDYQQWKKETLPDVGIYEGFNS